jgi:hypothetical protein
MVRTQIQFPEEDLKELRREAAEEGVSVSEVVRRYVAEGRRAKGRPSRAELWERASRAIGKFNSGLSDLGRRHDDYFVEAVLNDGVRRRVKPAGASRR